MKNKLSISVEHNNARRMEYFLNRVKEILVEVPFDWKRWKKSDRIIGGCQFISAGQKTSVSIQIIFCDSYHEANEIAKANALSYLPTAKWSVNGDVLYFVESADAEKVSDILGLFAGEE